MFFNRNYIPAVPIREEQRLSEEEELARQLKREARIFFPDKKLPDFDEDDLPPLPEVPKQDDRKPPVSLDKSPEREEPGKVLENHDAVCREEDSMWRKPDGRFTHHEVEAARQEEQQIAKNRQQLNGKEQSHLQSADEVMPADREIGSQMGDGHNSIRPRINKQELKRGILLKVILDKPRGLTPWKGDKF